jgi:hypothetical protein
MIPFEASATPKILRYLPRRGHFHLGRPTIKCNIRIGINIFARVFRRHHQIDKQAGLPIAASVTQGLREHGRKGVSRSHRQRPELVIEPLAAASGWSNPAMLGTHQFEDDINKNNTSHCTYENMCHLRNRHQNNLEHPTIF